MPEPLEQFTLGQHAARLDNIDNELKGIAIDVKTLLFASERRKGAWAIVITVSSASGAAAALLIALARAIWK